MNKEYFFYSRIYLFFVFLEVVLVGYLLFLVVFQKEPFFFDDEEVSEAPNKRQDQRWRDKWRKSSPGVRNTSVALVVNTAALLVSGYLHWNHRDMSPMPEQGNRPPGVPVPVTEAVRETVQVDTKRAEKTITKAVTRLEEDMAEVEAQKKNLVAKISLAKEEDKKILDKKMALIRQREEKNLETLKTIAKIVKNLQKNTAPAAYSKASQFTSAGMPQKEVFSR